MSLYVHPWQSPESRFVVSQAGGAHRPTDVNVKIDGALNDLFISMSPEQAADLAAKLTAHLEAVGYQPNAEPLVCICVGDAGTSVGYAKENCPVHGHLEAVQYVPPVLPAIPEAEPQAESEAETWPCNDCGLPCLKGDELCGPCYEKKQRSEEWDLLHPEARCPPRE